MLHLGREDDRLIVCGATDGQFDPVADHEFRRAADTS